jgi:uncharacterized membrane protein YagU involved in acid resistance
MSETSRELLAGSVAGLAATVPMTAVMELLHRPLPPGQRRPLPPRRVTMRAADAVGVADDLSEPERVGLTTAAHFGFGAAAGSVYGLLAPRDPVPAAAGVAYGLAVWAGSYMGWLPAMGLHPHPADEPAGRVAATVAAHVVWGAVLGVLTARMLPEEDRAVRPSRERERRGEGLSDGSRQVV